MCIVIISFSVDDVINFKIKCNFIIKPFPLHDQLFQGKNSNISRSKRAFKLKQKSFFIVFKGPSVPRNLHKPGSVPNKHYHLSLLTAVLHMLRIYNQYC